MPSALGRGIDEAMAGFNPSQHIPLNDKIPMEPELFYRSFGYLQHPLTRQPVKRLAGYQYDTWRLFQQYRRLLEVKTNKAGETTKWLMVDFQLSVLPPDNPLSCRGYDQLLLAQTKEHAKEHLRTLRKMLANSKKYNKYLIDRPSEIDEYQDGGLLSVRKLLRDEQTKTSVIYVRNPDNERQPSRIIALGIDNPGALASWKNVKNIHMSDPTMAIGNITESLNMALSRLANTNGSMVIETPPSPPSGPIYELWQKYRNKEEPQQGDFKVIEIPATMAVQAGIISQQFLDAEQERDPLNYERLYMAKFVGAAGSMFLPSEIDLCVKRYELATGSGSLIMAVDWGFGSSKTAIIGIERRNDGRAYVVESIEFERSSMSNVIDFIAKLYHRDNYRVCYADGSQPGIIKDLQDGSEATQRQPIHAIPVIFREELSTMSAAVVKAVRENTVLIHPDFRELISQLKTVQYDVKGNPDKSSYTMDLFDAFMMAVSHQSIGVVWADLGPG